MILVNEDFAIKDNVIVGRKEAYPEMNPKFGKIFLDVLDKDPEHLAQINVDTGESTNFRQLKDKTIRCALWMRKRNVGSGDVVTMCSPTRMEVVIPLLSAFYVGAVYNPWEDDIPLFTARRYMKMTRPKVIFTSPNNADVLAEAAKLEGIDAKLVSFGKHEKYESLEEALSEQTEDEVDNFEAVEIKNFDDSAVIGFSSGSTGTPKGVVHSYESVFKNMVVPKVFVNLPFKKSVNVNYVSPPWISTVMYLLKCTLHESTRLIHSEFHVEKTAEIIDKYQVTYAFISSKMMTQYIQTGFLKNNHHLFRSLVSAETGGVKVKRAIFTEFKELLPKLKFFNTLGSSESACGYLSQNENSKIPDSVGFVLPNTELKVIDENGNALGPYEPGELLVRRPVMLKEYFENPEETKALFNEEGWMKTGDKLMYDERGEFQYIDRLKEIMKYKCHHVSPSDLENHLLTNPEVLEVVVVGVPHEDDGQWPMAFVKKKEGSNVTEEQLVKLSADLGKFSTLWGGVKFLEEFPMTATGKIAKPNLVEMGKRIHHLF